MKQLEVAGYMYLRLSQLSGQLLLLGQLQTVNHFTLITTVIFDFCVSLSVFSLSLRGARVPSRSPPRAFGGKFSIADSDAQHASSVHSNLTNPQDLSEWPEKQK